MKKLFIYLSIILHIVVIILSLFKFSDIFNKKIQDKGYSVFDFVAIGDKSIAPVLSKDNGKASKIKSYAENKEDVINKQSNITQEQNNNKEKIKENNNDNSSKNKQEKSNNKINEDNINKKSNNDNNIPKKEDKNINNEKNKAKKKTTNIKNNVKNIDKKQNNSKSNTSKKINKDNNKKNNNKQLNKNNNQNKNASKNSNKALVNLKQNKKSSSKYNNKNNKKSFNSFLDNVLADGDNENTGANAESLGDTLTATQIDNVRNTIRKCWHFPAGLKNAETLVVDVKMELDKNGYVKKVEVVDKNRMKRDSNFKIAAENAQRAVLDPNCNPLPLPKEKYNEWKDLELSFNPKDML